MAAVPTTDHRLSTPEDGRLPPAVGPHTTDPSRTTDSLVEVQFDGLPGPTHHFGGLSHGNLASTGHAGFRSRPRAAARQGLAKMRAVLALGVVQALLPPLMRPDLDFLRDCGFAGNERAMLLGAEAEAPRLLRWAQSSAAMWTANCATVAPGIDSDGTTRLVVANLVATAHRQLEAAPRAAMLRRILRDVPAVAVIDALPALAALSDEGAANHCRLAAGEHGHPGVHLFVHGRAEGLAADRLPSRFPARQQRDASAAVARLLALPAPRVLHARQDPRAIDAGAFHTDVVMVADRDRALLHEHALVDHERVLAQLRALVPGLRAHVVAASDLALDDAVRSYLFNSQLLATPGGTVLVAPAQAGEGAAGRVVRRLLDEGLIDRALHLDLGESMANGGGPACLRLRVPLTAAQLAGVAPGVVLDEVKIAVLEGWVDRHYRETLSAEDLADPALLDEGRRAFDELTALLGLGALYRFQGGPC